MRPAQGLMIVTVILSAAIIAQAGDGLSNKVLMKMLIAEAPHKSSGDSQTLLAPTTQPLSPTTAPASIWSADVLDKPRIAALQRLSQAGQISVLSRPYFLTMENHVSTFSVGQPENVDEPISDLHGMIDVVAHLTNDGKIILDLAPVFQTPGQPDQAAANQNLMLHLSVQNGQSILIHGLVHEHKTLALQKIPVLGNLPLFGALFTGQRTSTSNWEVVILLTANVSLH